MGRFTKIDLGTFEQTSEDMVVSDPCYTLEVSCMGVLKNVKPGQYRATAYKINDSSWGERVALLSVVHDSVSEEDVCGLTHEWQDIDVGVDSGQCGLYDAKHFRDDSVIPGKITAPFGLPVGDDPGDKWYAHCGNITLGEIAAGVLPFGAVSRSGIGDGSYTCYAAKNKAGEIVAVSIDYWGNTEICAQVGIQYGPYSWELLQKIHQKLASNEFTADLMLAFNLKEDPNFVQQIIIDDMEDSVWIIGDKHGCIIASCNFLDRGAKASQGDATIQVLHYRFADKEDMDFAPWLPILEPAVEQIIERLLDNGIVVEISPSWVPEKYYKEMGKEVFDAKAEIATHILLAKDDIAFMTRRN